MEDKDKDGNNFKDISALGLNRDLEFSRGHRGLYSYLSGLRGWGKPIDLKRNQGHEMI